MLNNFLCETVSEIENTVPQAIAGVMNEEVNKNGAT